VDIRFEQNVLTIRGSKPAGFDAVNEGELRLFAAERVHAASSARSVFGVRRCREDRRRILNGTAHGDGPKAQAAQPRKISIRSNA
jgi:hypothetical protein